MKESRRTNMLIVIALLMIAVAFAAYSFIMINWFKPSSRPGAAMGSAAASRAETEDRLVS
jgi:flagellar basal body-associated protein FliL